jgi:hypothetical protein
MDDKISEKLTEIAQILDKHFNPPKKNKSNSVISLIIIGAVAIGGLYLLYQMIQPMFNYSLNINY